MINKLRPKGIWMLFVLLLLILVPLFAKGYHLYILSLSLVYVVVSIGLNLLTGYTGIISLGHAGFLAVGAYTAGIITNNFPSMPCLLVLLMAGLLTGITGFVMAISALRLAGFYLAMATLAFGIVMSELILQFESLTNGADGLFLGKASIGNFVLDTDHEIYYLILFFTVFLIAGAINISKTRMGRVLLAIRENEVSAKTSGINASIYKLKVFVISAFYTGIAGGLFAYLVSFISTDAFDLSLSINFLVMIVIGGIGSIGGSIIGAIVLTFLEQALSGFEAFRPLIFGLLTIMFMIFMPRGLIGIRDVMKKI